MIRCTRSCIPFVRCGDIVTFSNGLQWVVTYAGRMTTKLVLLKEEWHTSRGIKKEWWQ